MGHVTIYINIYICVRVRNARTKNCVHTAYMDAFYLDHRERFPLHMHQHWYVYHTRTTHIFPIENNEYLGQHDWCFR